MSIYVSSRKPISIEGTATIITTRETKIDKLINIDQNNVQNGCINNNGGKRIKN